MMFFSTSGAVAAFSRPISAWKLRCAVFSVASSARIPVDNSVDKKVIEGRIFLLNEPTPSGINPLMKFAAHRAAGSRS